MIMGLGLDYITGKPLINPMDEKTFADLLLEGLGANMDELRSLTKTGSIAPTFRLEVAREVERRRTADLGDPRSAGWTFLVNGKDPKLGEIIRAIRPLAEHRGMKDPKVPLVYNSEPQDEWFDWLLDNYTSLGVEKVPHYILIVGGPQQVPFLFQSLLDSAASVGRVDFDSIDDLEVYVEKVIRLETAAGPTVERATLFFAPDAGPNDPTYFSRKYMAEPLAEHVKSRCGLDSKLVVANDATKDRLVAELTGSRPAIVYTASHGLGAPSEPLEIQKRFNGAICCQSAGQLTLDSLYCADDVPAGEPFLEGSIFFQFACFGYGTPAESNFMHWLRRPGLNSTEDFVSALPKRLVSHPRGPAAYIGHVDTAWLHGFDDPNSPHLIEKWHPRIAPFVFALETLLQVQPAGIALSDMNKKYDITNAMLTNTIDRMQRGRLRMSPEVQAALADTFITRTDSQNYMVFGDPAVRLRLPT